MTPPPPDRRGGKKPRRGGARGAKGTGDAAGRQHQRNSDNWKRKQSTGSPKQRQDDRREKKEPDALDAAASERIVYGRHPVREAILGCRSVHRLHATESALRDLQQNVAKNHLLHLAAKNIPFVSATPQELTALSGTGDHQGIVAEVAPFPYCSFEDLIDDAAPLIFALDQITDPHNLGAIARVCDSVGGSGIVLTEHRSARVTGAVCKASAGAIEHVKVALVTNLAETLARNKTGSLWTFGASEKGVLDYTRGNYEDGVIFVLGAEGAGIRPRVRDNCDELIRLPMQGQVSSLNVSTVAAVLAYECVRQRSETGD